jgi:hypothetical protein
LDDNGKPVGAGYLSSRLISFTVEDYKQFNHLSKTALEFVNARTSALEKQLISEAQTLSDDELNKLKPVRQSHHSSSRPSSPVKTKNKLVISGYNHHFNQENDTFCPVRST